MTKYYCDICNKQIFVKNPIRVLVAPSVYQEYDVCNDCSKAIDEAKNKAEIEIVKELRRN